MSGTITDTTQATTWDVRTKAMMSTKPPGRKKHPVMNLTSNCLKAVDPRQFYFPENKYGYRTDGNRARNRGCHLHGVRCEFMRWPQVGPAGDGLRSLQGIAMTCNGLRSRYGQGFTRGRRSATLATAATAQHATTGLEASPRVNGEHRRRASGAILTRLNGHSLLALLHFPLIRLTKCTDCDGLQGTAMICKPVRISDCHCRLGGMRRWRYAMVDFQKYAAADLLSR
jgi:hypothetical protein